MNCFASVTISVKRVFASTLALVLLAPFQVSQATPLRVIYEFSGEPDGRYPEAGLLLDPAGNLYGTTYYGGTHHNGTVFKLAPDGTETVLHNFSYKRSDAANPRAGVIMDSSGNLYGTTGGGGVGSLLGTVFKISPDGTETILHSFTGSDGLAPVAPLIIDKAGNLYGTTVAGGTGTCGGCGVVFKIAPDGTASVLYSFQGGKDGADPEAGLLVDSAGIFYGTTSEGGINDTNGTVFKLAPDGTETILHRFKGSDGNLPWGGLIEDAEGNLYGTTSEGGSYGGGTVFRLTPDGTETVLHSFSGRKDGSSPLDTLLMDKEGNLYGTTNLGGATDRCFAPNGCGTIFRLTPDGTLTVLHTFTKENGELPYGGLVADKSGYLYGATQKGGQGKGVVFQIKK